jgi:two-component SAPR family response regulator
MKVIAVDDEKIALQGLLSAIQQAAPNAEIHGFRYAREAVAHMEIDPCDVAFLDIEMKEMSGVEVAKKLKAINPDINIIFATGFGSYRDVAFDLHASGYLVKPITVASVKREFENLRRPVSTPKRLQIRAFGNFEVLFNHTPLRFKYQKTKELLAYLVDRKGAMCSTGEIMSVLFEDEGHDAYYQRLRSDLRSVFASIGCESLIVQQKGLLGLATDEIDCDYYDYLNGNVSLEKLYHGEYMKQYTFAEFTNAELFAKFQKSNNHDT